MTRSLPFGRYGNNKPRNAYRDNPCKRFAGQKYEWNADDQNDQHKAEHDGSVTDG